MGKTQRHRSKLRSKTFHLSLDLCVHSALHVWCENIFWTFGINCRNIKQTAVLRVMGKVVGSVNSSHGISVLATSQPISVWCVRVVSFSAGILWFFTVQTAFIIFFWHKVAVVATCPFLCLNTQTEQTKSNDSKSNQKPSDWIHTRILLSRPRFVDLFFQYKQMNKALAAAASLALVRNHNPYRCCPLCLADLTQTT